MLKRLGLIVTLLVTPSCALHQQPTKQPSLAGTYQCVGLSAEGHPYQGAVEIVDHVHTVSLHWVLASGDEAYGFGFHRDGGIVVVFVMDGTPGTAYYERHGSELRGRWSIAGVDGVFFETLTPSSRAMPSHPPVKPKAKEKDELES